MKRGAPLRRTSSLKRSGPLRQRRKPPIAPPGNEAARALWKVPHAGWCECGCDPPAFALHLERHHVFPLSRLRQMGRLDVAWNLDNSMLLSPRHHALHTSAMRKIPLSSVPDEALLFVQDVLGFDRSLLFFARTYAAEIEGGGWQP